jgi:hypothetical protein
MKHFENNGADGFIVDASDGNELRRNIGKANGSIGSWARNDASFKSDGAEQGGVESSTPRRSALSQSG